MATSSDQQVNFEFSIDGKVAWLTNSGQIVLYDPVLCNIPLDMLINADPVQPETVRTFDQVIQAFSDANLVMPMPIGPVASRPDSTISVSVLELPVSHSDGAVDGIAPGTIPIYFEYPQELAEQANGTDMTLEPLFVNAKQFHRIVKRREQRKQIEARHSMERGKKRYLHESRHLHAIRRARGVGGRFLKCSGAQGMGATECAVWATPGVPQGSTTETSGGCNSEVPPGASAGVSQGPSLGAKDEGSTAGMPRRPTIGVLRGISLGVPYGATLRLPQGTTLALPHGTKLGVTRGLRLGAPRGSTPGVPSRGIAPGPPRRITIGQPRRAVVGVPRGSMPRAPRGTMLRVPTGGFPVVRQCCSVGGVPLRPVSTVEEEHVKVGGRGDEDLKGDVQTNNEGSTTTPTQSTGTTPVVISEVKIELPIVKQEEEK